MTHAVGMGPLPRLLAQEAGARHVCNAFRTSGLPRMLEEEPHHRIPFAGLVKLFDAAGDLAADRLFGLRVGLGMTHLSYGIVAEYAAQAPTLRAALERLRVALPVHLTNASFRLAVSGGHAEWTFVPPGDDLPSAQHLDHVTPVLVSFLRSYLGAGWQPDFVRNGYPEDDATPLRAEVLGVPVIHGGIGLTIGFDARLLDTYRPGGAPERTLTSSEVLARAVRNRPGALSDQLDAIVALRLLDAETDIEGVAQLAEMSVRSLQRHLRAEGQSYRELLDRVRLRRARALLRETQMPITQIALALGYDEPASFSRAVRRVTGAPPQALRRT